MPNAGSNLRPELRVDKNGVLTTKHVRNEPAKSSTRVPLPAPTSSPSADLAYAHKEDAWGLTNKDWACDQELELVCRAESRDKRAFWCSNAAAYEVLSVVAPESVAPLLAAGMRTADETKGFLERNGLSRLIEDNSVLAEKAYNVRIKAQDFLEFAAAYSSRTDSQFFMDAANAHTNRYIRQIVDRQQSDKAGESLIGLILDGEVRLEDINEISPKVIKELSIHDNPTMEMFRQHSYTDGYSTVDNYMIDQLRALAKGETAYSSSGELSLVLLNAHEDGAVHPRTAVEIAAAYGDGTAEVINANNWIVAKTLASALSRGNKTPEEKRKVLDYRLSIKSKYHAPEETIEMYEAGVSSENASRYLNKELTLEQTIALDRGEVAPSLTQGVL